MSIHTLRLALSIFWLVMGLVLLLREYILPKAWYINFRQLNLTLGGWMSLALAGWNGARWYQYYAWKKSIEPISTKQGNALSERKLNNVYEYNPELDFFKQTEPDQPSGGNPNTSAG